jgi:hypothetical protein
MDRVRLAFLTLLIFALLTMLAWFHMIFAVPAREPMPALPRDVTFAMITDHKGDDNAF